MAEVVISNLIIGIFCFFLFYFPYKNLCSGFWDYTKVVIPMLVIYYIFYFGAVMGMSINIPSTHLWYPYSFGGMPAYPFGYVGVKWWNHIDTMHHAFLTTLLTNPIFTALFYLSILWLLIRYKNGKRIWWNYPIIILAELTMIFLTEW